MPFTNPIIAGEDLVRPSIRSPDYVAGVSGWRIARDGSAEFNDLTARGELLVDGPDGSEIRIYVVTSVPTPVPVIEMKPRNDAGGTGFDPGFIVADHTGGADERPFLGFVAPSPSSPDIAELRLYGTGDVSTETLAELTTDSLTVDQIASATGEADFSLDGVSQARGFRGSGASTSATAAIGATETVVLTISSHVFTDGRCYRITMEGAITGSAATNQVFFRLRKTNAAGAILGDFWRWVTDTGASGKNVGATRFIRNVSGGQITADLVLTMSCNAGTATMTANGQAPRFIVSEDCGDAADFATMALNIT